MKNSLVLKKYDLLCCGWRSDDYDDNDDDSTCTPSNYIIILRMK